LSIRIKRKKFFLLSRESHLILLVEKLFLVIFGTLMGRLTTLTSFSLKVFYLEIPIV